MNVPTWVWIACVGVTLAVLLVDVLWLARKPHVPSNRETGTALTVYVTMAVLFGIGVWMTSGGRFAGEFFAGWLTEYSLSIDNLFIFIIIMAKFNVPRKFQQEALMIGIIIALILRAIFIGVGAVAINKLAWIFYIFGAFLIYTAIKLARENHNDEDDDFQENKLLKFVEGRFPVTQSWEHGAHFRAVENGAKVLTPFAIVILALGTTDLLFALDSIPAIYGLTKEPFLVLMANIFALMGLRQLYFLIGGLLQKLVYLSIGLAVLLAFIGVKLIMHALHENNLPFINGGKPLHSVPDIPIWLSLGVIIGVLAITAVLSLMKSSRDEKRKQELGASE